MNNSRQELPGRSASPCFWSLICILDFEGRTKGGEVMNLKISQFASVGLDPQVKKRDEWPIQLAIRIINQAFMDLRLRNPSSAEAKEWQQDAYEWFLSEETAPGSLVWWCQILETDPSIIRKKLFGEAEKKAS